MLCRAACLALAVATLALVVGCGTRASESSPHGAQAGAQAAEAAPGERPTAYPDRIVLTWAQDPATSLSVTWRTDTTVAEARAEVAVATASPGFFADARTVEATTEPLDARSIDGAAPVQAHYHAATFEGLEPGTTYAYRVGDGTRWSEWFHARTASDDPAAPFAFIYFGDAQNDLHALWSRAIRAAYAEAPDALFMLHAGDLVNRAHRNVEWGEWNRAGGFIQGMLPSVPVPGNHEYDPYERFVEADTFALTATVAGGQMTGTLIEPDGDDEPWEATRDEAGSGEGGFAGTWTFAVDDDDYEGTLRLREAGGGGLGGALTLTGGDDAQTLGAEVPLLRAEATGDTLSLAYVTEFEKEGEEHLSVFWRPQFTLPENGIEGEEETVYALDVQGVRVVALNSAPALDDPALLQRQTAWLDSVLTASEQRWTVVAFHHPLFSSSVGRDNEELRAAWKPLFDAHRVDLVLQGHDHTYARGRAQNVAQGVNTRDQGAGTVYVNSVSGPKMYELKPERWDAYDGVTLERAAENTQLFQVVRVTPDTLRYRAFTVMGDLYDAFDLVKREGRANAFVPRMDAARAERTHANTAAYRRMGE